MSSKDKVKEQIKIRKKQENENLKRKQITQNILDMDDFRSPNKPSRKNPKPFFKTGSSKPRSQGSKA
jgi:hypothetical protein